MPDIIQWISALPVGLGVLVALLMVAAFFLIAPVAVIAMAYAVCLWVALWGAWLGLVCRGTKAIERACGRIKHQEAKGGTT